MIIYYSRKILVIKQQESEDQITQQTPAFVIKSAPEPGISLKSGCFPRTWFPLNKKPIKSFPDSKFLLKHIHYKITGIDLFYLNK